MERTWRTIEKIFNVTGDEVFTVNDIWNNYDKIGTAIDEAYRKWSGLNCRANVGMVAD